MNSFTKNDNYAVAFHGSRKHTPAFFKDGFKALEDKSMADNMHLIAGPGHYFADTEGLPNRYAGSLIDVPIGEHPHLAKVKIFNHDKFFELTRKYDPSDAVDRDIISRISESVSKFDSRFSGEKSFFNTFISHNRPSKGMDLYDHLAGTFGVKSKQVANKIFNDAGFPGFTITEGRIQISVAFNESDIKSFWEPIASNEIKSPSEELLSGTFFHASAKRENVGGIIKSWFDPSKSKWGGATYFTKSPTFANRFIGFDSTDQKRTAAAYKAIEKGKNTPALFPVNIENGRYFNPANDDHINVIRGDIKKFIASDDNIHGLKSESEVINTLKDTSKDSWNILEHSNISSRIKSEGFDGFFIRESGVENLAVLNSNKIKSSFALGKKIAIESSVLPRVSNIKSTGFGNYTSKIMNIFSNVFK